MVAPLRYLDETIAEVAAQLAGNDALRRALTGEWSVHLAVLAEPWWGWTLNGSRTVEGRFTRTRTAPYGVAHAGQLALLKRPGGKIEAVARIAGAEHVPLRRPADLERVRDRYGAAMRSDLIAGFWQAQESARYASMVTFIDLTVLPRPVYVSKLGARSWVVLKATSAQLALLGSGT